MTVLRRVVGGLAVFLWLCALVLIAVRPPATLPGDDVHRGRCEQRAFEELLRGAPGDACRESAARRTAHIAELSLLATMSSFGYLALQRRP